VLQNQEGKRLFCEAFYLYGCMLLLLDNLIIGSVREKLVIAYYRYKGGQSAITYINEVCRLCKDTGYLPAQFTDGTTPKRP
jgi:WASH complex subunit strumpellin